MEAPTGLSNTLPPGFERNPNGTCTVTLVLNAANGGKVELELGESYDTVFDKVNPLTPPQSSMELRRISQHTLRDGRRISFSPSIVAVLTEDSP